MYFRRFLGCTASFSVAPRPSIVLKIRSSAAGYSSVTLKSSWLHNRLLVCGADHPGSTGDYSVVLQVTRGSTAGYLTVLQVTRPYCSPVLKATRLCRRLLARAAAAPPPPSPGCRRSSSSRRSSRSSNSSSRQSHILRNTTVTSQSRPRSSGRGHTKMSSRTPSIR